MAPRVGPLRQRGPEVFLSVHLAEESGDPKSVPADDLFPDAGEALAAEISRRKAGGIAVQYRNLCVRKVELIHVRNMSDNRLDEFTVRISAHAQKGLRMHSGVVTEQEYVTPFVEFWTFGRLDNRWKLKEVVPEMKGQQMLAAENVDQDSSPSQVRWYYKQTRAV